MSTAEKSIRPVLIAGEWRQAKYEHTFKASNPNKNELLPVEFPVSQWEDCDAALEAASQAARELRQLPASKIADFLECYADRIEAANPLNETTIPRIAAVSNCQVVKRALLGATA